MFQRYLLFILTSLCSYSLARPSEGSIETGEGDYNNKGERNIINAISSCRKHPVISSLVTKAWIDFLDSYKKLVEENRIPGEHKVILTYAFNPRQINANIHRSGYNLWRNYKAKKKRKR
uniref:Uncharacterized protein n=1 Tax=Acrobeloides nanus TaxID=290746 RepID=A0A914DN76_9BILA